MSEIDALRTERATITEEKRALQRESEDLSRQVQLLLREVQQARERSGERFGGEDLRAAEPSPLVDIQGELVPEHLIAFTSIQSMQQNNVELLRVRVCLSVCLSTADVLSSIRGLSVLSSVGAQAARRTQARGRTGALGRVNGSEGGAR